MKEHELDKLLSDTNLIMEKIREFQAQGILKMQKEDPEELQGHLLKADHNLRFVSEFEIFLGNAAF